MKTKTQKATKMDDAAKPEVIPAFKGFDLNMQCRQFQFKEGETYEHDGKVKACESGFHSCENPLDVFGYYPPSTSVFAEVEASGKIARDSDDSKVASGKLHIKAMISLPDYVGRAIKWVTDHCAPATSNHVVADKAASSATGDSSASSATGYRSASSATGIAAVAMSIGRYGRAKASKDAAIVLCEHDDAGKLLHIRASKVGENGIEADVFYTLTNGEFVKAEVQS
ncbi:MAG: hypothetical protein RB191_11520 [Terriglobia bacterium]|nr:hypothetical protein [Terriglobia bacterium]